LNRPDYIAGASFDREALLSLAKLVLSNEESPTFQLAVWQFVQDWLDETVLIQVKTSGSTGKPTKKQIPKRWMQSSAKATGEVLGLKAGQSALLCISAEHIGGMMMIVRSLELGLNLSIEAPSRLPHSSEKMDFTAMVPMQVKSLIQDGNDLSAFGTLIIGGAPQDPETLLKIRKVNSPVFATFGMTETVSHIALRRLSGDLASDIFHTIEGVSVSKNEEDCLVIDVEHMDNMSLTSNDLVEIIDSSHFRWLGRIDNVINSGGIKINPEALESELSEAVSTSFFIHKEEDDTYGESVVICLEGVEMNEQIIRDALRTIADSRKRPKRAYVIQKFIYTSTGKVKRNQTFLQEKRRLY